MSRINKKTLTAYLSWAIDRDITVEKWTTLSGGIHQNLHIYTRSNTGKQEYVIRVMPFARNNMLPYDMQTEYFALKDLEKVDLSTPKVWGLDLEGQFLGQAVFAMEFVEGISVLDAASDSPKEIPRLFTEAIWKMNQISPDQVPSVATKDPNPQGISNPLSWVQNQLPLSQLPHLRIGTVFSSARTIPRYSCESDDRETIQTGSGTRAVPGCVHSGRAECCPQGTGTSRRDRYNPPHHHRER